MTKKEQIEEMAKTPFIYILAMFMIAIISVGLVLMSEYQKRKLESKVSEMSYLVEGEVIAVSKDGGTLYCVSDYTPDGYVDEVDMFDEMLCNCFHVRGYDCRIKVGDRVIYAVDANWQDADFIGKIHEE